MNWLRKIFSPRPISNVAVGSSSIPENIESPAQSAQEAIPTSALLTSLGAVFYTPDYLSQFPEHIGNIEDVYSLTKNIYVSAWRPNVLIVGNQGDGKRSLVRAFARSISANWRQYDFSNTIGKPLIIEIKGRTFAENQSGLVRLAHHLDRELNTLLFDEIAGRTIRHKVILFIDGIHEALGHKGSTDSLRAFSKALWDHDNYSVGTIGTTDFANSDFMKGDESLGIRWSRKIYLKQKAFDESVAILDANLAFLEHSRKVKLSGITTQRLAHLAREYVADAVLPGSACDLLNAAADQTVRHAVYVDPKPNDDVGCDDDAQTIYVEDVIRAAVEKTGYEAEFLHRAAVWHPSDVDNFQDAELKSRIRDPQLVAAILKSDVRRAFGYIKRPFTITVFGGSQHLEEIARTADIILFGGKAVVSPNDVCFDTCVVDFHHLNDAEFLNAKLDQLAIVLSQRRARTVLFLNVDRASSLAMHHIERIIDQGETEAGFYPTSKTLKFAKALLLVHCGRMPSQFEVPIHVDVDSELERRKKFQAGKIKKVRSPSEWEPDALAATLFGLSDQVVRASV